MIYPNFAELVGNTAQYVEIARTLIYFGVSLLPFAHIEYVRGNDPYDIKVVPTKEHLPKGAVPIHSYENNDFVNFWPLRELDEDWVAFMHTDDPTNISSGELPVKRVVLPNSASLTRDEAVLLGRRLGLFT